MVEELRRRQAVEIAALADTITRARAAGTPDDVIRDLTELHDRMRAELE
jgi:hypothetical protein